VAKFFGEGFGKPLFFKKGVSQKFFHQNTFYETLLKKILFKNKKIQHSEIVGFRRLNPTYES
jgi:hypothetical protein